MAKKKKGGKYADAPKGKKALAKEKKRLEEERKKKAAEAAVNGDGGTGNGESKSVARIGRPTPECYPHIVATYGTNENKVHSNARTIQVENLSISYHGMELLKDTNLTLSYGQRYGLVGMNGSGKTTLLRAISARMIPIPTTIDTYTVERGMDKTDKTALEAVLEVDDVIKELEKEADILTEKLGDEALSEEQQAEISDELTNIYEHLDELGAETAETRAASILSGLGFTKEMQAQKTKDFSGGWRMRISLARALYLNPTFLILDEPTNHLDMEAVVWFEEYLKNFQKILLLVSHSQDFLNGVCTNIILLRNRKLEYFGGNYDTYVRTRREKETMQMKRYEWEQDQVKHMKEYIARFGHGSAKLAKQAQSKEKTLEKMTRAGLTEKVVQDKVVSFTFVKCGKLPPPVLQLQEVSFGYPDCPLLYKKVDFGMDLDSRIALVGPNGAGKSTMLKLLTGELHPTDGMVRRHHHLKISKFAQHFIEEIPLDISPLSYMMQEFPKDNEGKVMTQEKMRSIIGRFGITGPAQTMEIKLLSDGQVSRLAFARIYMQRPHLLLLDEPTNHLDIESIDSLANAINEFDGGMCLVSHDMRLIGQVAKEIWICDKGTLTRYNGSIMDFKMELQKELVKKEKREKKEAEIKKKKKAQDKSSIHEEEKANGLSARENGILTMNGKSFEMSKKKDDEVDVFGKASSSSSADGKEDCPNSGKAE